MLDFNTTPRQLFRTLLPLFSLLFPLTSFAQSGTVRGTLLDAVTSQPIPFANVVLLKAQDSSFVAGAQTSETGAFALEKLPLGSFMLRATVLGYRSARKPVAVAAASPGVQLGTLKLRPTATQLKGVVVQGQRAVVTDNLDKKVIDVSKDLTVTGGTATDVLQNVPSVSVDQNGAVSLRGSGNVTILIDGKPTGTSLDQIPASSIQTVEVVTNPSARYDASGTAGIINIVLKKEKRDGLNGVTTENVGTKDKYNTSVGLNYHQGRWNVFGSYDLRQDRRTGYGTQTQNTVLSERFISGPDTSYNREALLLTQNRTSVNYNTSHALRLGFDYALTPTQTLTFAVQPRFNRQSSIEDIISRQNNTSEGNQPVRLGTYKRYNTATGYSNSADISLDYRRSWAEQKGRELTANAVFTPIQNRNTLNSTIYYGPDNRYSPNDSTTFQQQQPTTTTRQASAQLDYVQPLGEKSRFEAGLRSTLRQYDIDYSFVSRTPLRFNPSNRFLYDQYVQAAYANYANAWGSFSYQAGLRLEQTNLQGNQVTTHDTFSRHYLDLFPSATLAYDLSKEQRVQLSYSRRIQRPDAGELNPFTDRSDQFNLVTGNPLLLPEYNHAVELGDQKFFGYNSSISATGFYRLETNTAQGFRQLITDPLTGNQVISTTRLNLGRETSYGLELVGSTALASFWKVNANASTFRRLIKGAGPRTDINTSNQVYTARINTVLSPTKKLDLQLALNYRSPIVSAQGLRRTVFNTDFAAKYNVLKDKGTVTLRVSDVFNTLRFNFDSYGNDFAATSRNKRESRIAFVGFTYRFGKIQQSQRPKRADQGDEPAGGGFE